MTSGSKLKTQKAQGEALGLWVRIDRKATALPMLDFTLTAFLSVLFLVDPPGCVPAFLALTANETPEKRSRTALVACIAATLTLMAFALVGTYLFRILGLTLPAFQIAGG